MRRILLTATGTLAAVVAVFLYPTSTNQGVAAEVSTTTDATTSAATSSSADSSTADPSTSGAGDSSTTGSTDSATTDSSTSTGSSSSSSGTSATTASALADGTYSGSSTMRYGTVTVTITVSDGQITDASGVQDSNDNRSQMIASQALPTLDSEAVSAQSASIAMVSHATFTSSAYEQSLQAAIDQAFGG